jgi:transposase
MSGVDPTHHAAERALQSVVIWRKTRSEAKSQSGRQFVLRLLTVTTSLKAQDRNILDFLIHACLAARTGKESPSLLP